MNSLYLKNDEEEDRFFDAHDYSVSSSPCDNEFGLSSNFDYDVWTKIPDSVQQRRKFFINKMGFDSGTTQEENIDRIVTNSGAVLRTSSVDHEFSSSLFSSSSTNDLSISDETNSDLNGIGNLNGEGDFSENGLGKRVKRKKSNITKKWLNRLRSITSIEYKKWVPKKFSPSKEVEVERVGVHYCKKRIKELSALFMGQNIRAHEGSILSMKFNLDGRYLATGGEDGIIRVWQIVVDTNLSKKCSNLDPSCVYLRVNNCSELMPFDFEKEKMVNFRKKMTESVCVIFPPVVFRILEEPLHMFHGHSDEILDLSWSKNNCLLSASTDNTVRLWQVGCENCIKVFRHNDYVTCVQFNPMDESRFVSGSIDGKVRIWEISGCQVVGWTHIIDIVTAVCYRPNGQGLVVGSMGGTCRFYNTTDDFFELEAQISLHRKKKSQCKRINGLQFFPQDHDKLMVTCACSRVKILHGINVIGKIKGSRKSGNQLRASFTPNGKHIISTSNDSNIYLYNLIDKFELSQPLPKTMSYWERFSANASIAMPWFGFKTINFDNTQVFSQDEITNNMVPLASPSHFFLQKELVLEPSTKVSATWPEEKLVFPFMQRSDYKFLKKCQSKTGHHAWNMVIISAGHDGRIRLFHNYEIPVAL